MQRPLSDCTEIIDKKKANLDVETIFSIQLMIVNHWIVWFIRPEMFSFQRQPVMASEASPQTPNRYFTV